MPVFKTTAGAPSSSKKLNPIPLARNDLQKLIEENLSEMLDLGFLKSWSNTAKDRWIDTLAVDSGNAPVVIEYKRSKNYAVIKQALSYLTWLKDQNPEFFKKLMNGKPGQIGYRKTRLDWKNPRVIFIADEFSPFDIRAVDRVCTRIELMRYCNYEGGIFTLEQANFQKIGPRKKKRPSGKYTLIDHVKKRSPEVCGIFYGLQERILDLDKDITENPTQDYIAYRLSDNCVVSHNFAEIHVEVTGLKIHLRPMDYDDPDDLVNPPPSEPAITMHRYVWIKSVEESDYVFGLIEQSYRDVL